MPQAMNSPVLRNDHDRAEEIPSPAPRRAYRPLHAPGALRVVVRDIVAPVPANKPKVSPEGASPFTFDFSEPSPIQDAPDRPKFKLAARLVSAGAFMAWIFLMLSMAGTGDLLQLGAITLIPFLAHVISLYLASLGGRDFGGTAAATENS